MTDTKPSRSRDRLLDADSATRKTFPMFSGLLAYFPDALAYVAFVSHEGNEKHNPGEPMHHARGKSMDHADCIARHLTRHGSFDGKVRESGALAWRALALLQEELEQAHGLPLPRGARGAATESGSPVVPANGGFVEVKQQPGESMSEAICRTSREAQGIAKPETKFGFTVGETVNWKRSKKGVRPGSVVGFTGSHIKVRWQGDPETSFGKWASFELRHGE